jgi:hypothetical protein
MRLVFFLSMLLLLRLPGPASGQVENPHGELSIACDECHTTDSWEGISFPHGETGFSLEGSHASLACTRCHDLRDFAAPGRACGDCHEDVHEAKMGPVCERCHTTERWEVFNVEEIHRETRYPLFGKHDLIDCLSCHPNLSEGDYTRGVAACVDCHEEDYLAAENPRHVSLGFSTLCMECHELVEWRPAFFAGHDAIFPIYSGEHRGVWRTCETCHADPADYGVFSCTVCHRQGATDSRHQGVPGYSYDSEACFLCHPTGSGEGLLRNHDTDYFPISSGPHASVWSSCTDCHTDPGNWVVFTCIDCHAHEQSGMDQQHAGIPGYQWESPLCLSCHPTGEGGEFREHDSLYFPIYSGSHREAWASCVDCHFDPGDRAQFTCVDCHAHDRARIDEEHGEVSGYVYESGACFECHPSGGESLIWKNVRPSKR